MAGVTSSYPAALDSESNLTPPNNGDTLSVADHWLAGNSGPIVAIETELGTDPAGTFTDVKSRLDDVDKNVITEIDRWYWTTSISVPGGILNALRASSLGDYWSQDFTKGSGMTQNHNSLGNGNFGFSENGIYEVSASIGDLYNFGGSNSYAFLRISLSTDNGSSYTTISTMYNTSYSVPAEIGIRTKAIINVTDYTQTTFYLGLQAGVSHSFSGGSQITNLQSIKIGEV